MAGGYRPWNSQLAPENGWLADDGFLSKKTIFRCELLVSGTVDLTYDHTLDVWPLARLPFRMGPVTLKLVPTFSHHSHHQISSNIVHDRRISTTIKFRQTSPNVIQYYCWWKKSQTTTWDVYNLVNTGIVTIPINCRRISEPSTVSPNNIMYDLN